MIVKYYFLLTRLLHMGFEDILCILNQELFGKYWCDARIEPMLKEFVLTVAHVLLDVFCT